VGDPMNIPWKIGFLLGRYPLNTPGNIAKRRQSSFPLRVHVKGIARAFNCLKCVCAILHHKLTAGCQISTLIFELFGGSYKYPMTTCQRTAKFFPTWDLSQRYCPTNKLTYVPGRDSAPQNHSRVSNINFDIWNCWGDPINIPWKIAKGRQSSFPFRFKSKV
jgi:hypothetical protein